MVGAIIVAGFVLGIIVNVAVATFGCMTGVTRRRCPSAARRRPTPGASRRRARRDAPRPDPDPVGQPAAGRTRRTASSARRGWIAQALGDAGIPAGDPRGRARPRLGDGAAPRRRHRRRAAPAALAPRRRPGPARRAGPTTRSAADLADGYIWGRGAVDMKHLVAMELDRRADARRRGPRRRSRPGQRPDPGPDAATSSSPRPPTRRRAASTGSLPIVLERPELLRAAGAINESGAVATTFGGGRFYPIGVAEKGYAVYRITVHGTWGHGSMPRDDNAAVLAARIVTRLADPGPASADAGDGTVPRRRRERSLGRGPAPPRRRARRPGPAARGGRARAACDPISARVLRALLRDTVSPNIDPRRA